MGANTTSGVEDEIASPRDAELEPAAPAPPTTHDIVVIGASAGGVDALRAVVASLPDDYTGSVFVVLHIPPSVPSVLPSILARSSRLLCVSATDDAPIRPGTVYVAPPNFHMVLEPGRVRLVPGPRENSHRPAIDPLFRSAVAAYGARVAGVVLTGNLDDGTRGLLAITQQGGLAIVQSPEDADFPGMPLSAIANVPVHHVLPAASIGALLATVAPRLPSASAAPNRATPISPSMSDDPTPRVASTSPLEPELLAVPPAANGVPVNAVPVNAVPVNAVPVNAVPVNAVPVNAVPVPGASANGGPANGGGTAGLAPRPVERFIERAADLQTGIGIVDGGARINESLGGTVSAFTCPECHGALWELRDGVLLRYRCRVGHSYTDQGLVDNKARAVEDALWTALTALEESAAIAARVAQRAIEQGRPRSATTFRERAEYLEQRGALLRDVLNDLPGHVDGI